MSEQGDYLPIGNTLPHEQSFIERKWLSWSEKEGGLESSALSRTEGQLAWVKSKLARLGVTAPEEIPAFHLQGTKPDLWKLRITAKTYTVMRTQYQDRAIAPDSTEALLKLNEHIGKQIPRGIV